MTYDILATGSSGNAVVINGEILVDIGVPMKTLRESGYIKSLKLVLLTHEHGDHFNRSTVRALHKERPALRWGCCEWMVNPLVETEVDKRVIDVYELLRGMWYPSFCDVHPIPLVHDVPNCGYIISQRGERLFYATDTGTLVGVVAKNCELYLIEANHTSADIQVRIVKKQARGEFAYEVRAQRNHLSQEQALDWLARNAGPNSHYVFLHQHKEIYNGT